MEIALERRTGREYLAWPLLAASIFLALLTWKPAVQRMAAPFPLSPWESTIVRDGWRITQGESVYVLPEQGPATHMYGPLITYLSAAAFWWTGPSVHVPRTIACIFAALTVIAFPLVLMRGVNWSFNNVCLRIFVAAMVFAQFFRCRALYAESRPDAAAGFCALSAIWMLFLAHRKQSVLWLSLGTAAVVAGFFFKQTAAAAAGVPIVAIMCLRPRPMRTQLFMSLVPATTIVIIVLLMRFLWRPGYFYLIDVPGKFALQSGMSIQAFFYLLACNSLFIIAVGVWLVDIARKDETATLRAPDGLVWAFAAVMVLGAAAWLAFIKHGGAINSFLPVYLAMAAFVALMLRRAMEWFQRVKLPAWSGTLAACGIGALLLADVQSIPRVWVLASTKTLVQGDSDYQRVISRASELHGTVVCFDDPTISLLAKGLVGRSLHVELDAAGKAYVPAGLIDEVQSANWIIRVHGSWDELDARLNLKEQGFSVADDPVIHGPMYTLWTRR